jgi:F-type H+-transporting ATPase subunit b
MRTPFGLPIPAILAVALACLSSPLLAQEPDVDPAPPPAAREAVDPPKAEEPPVAEEADTAAIGDVRDPSNDKGPENPSIGAAEAIEAIIDEGASEAADEQPAEAVDEETAVAADEANEHDGHGHGGLHKDAGHGGHDAHGGGHSTVTLFGREYGDPGQFVLKLTNFLIFAFLLFLMLRGALSKAFKARALDIEMKLAQSKRDAWDAESQMRELDAKMSNLEGELVGILEKAEGDAEIEKQRILDAARAEAEQLLAQARAEIDHQRRVAESELRGLVSRLAVEGAEARILQRVAGDQAAAVMDQAIRRVGGAG